MNRLNRSIEFFQSIGLDPIEMDGLILHALDVIDNYQDSDVSIQAKLVIILLEAFPDALNIPDILGWLPIHKAAMYSHVDILKIITEANLENLTKVVPAFGSAAHCAAVCERPENARYIHSELFLTSPHLCPICYAMQSCYYNKNSRYSSYWEFGLDSGDPHIHWRKSAITSILTLVMQVTDLEISVSHVTKQSKALLEIMNTFCRPFPNSFAMCALGPSILFVIIVRQLSGSETCGLQRRQPTARTL
eukprot:gene31235-40600_t